MVRSTMLFGVCSAPAPSHPFLGFAVGSSGLMLPRCGLTLAQVPTPTPLLVDSGTESLAPRLDTSTTPTTTTTAAAAAAAAVE